MVKLIEELDFNLELSGSGYKWEVAHKPRYTYPWSNEQAQEIKQQILEDNKLRELIEKRIKIVKFKVGKYLGKKGYETDLLIYNNELEELQNLLKESKKW